MRKTAILVMLVLVAAMLPMTTASSQLDGVGTVNFINANTLNQPVDLWVQVEGSNWHKFDNFASPSSQKFKLPDGTHGFRVCNATPDTTDQSCADGLPYLGLSTAGSFNLEANDQLTAVVTDLLPTTYLYVAENDTDKTEEDQARMTIHNVTATDVDVCVAGEHILHVPPLSSADADFPAKDGEEQEMIVWALTFVFPGTCDPTAGTGAATVRQQGFPPGTNLVVTIPLNLFCSESCGDLIIVGEETVDSSAQIDPFCQALLDAQTGILPALQDLFAEVEVGDPDTYPSPEKVESVVSKVIEIIEHGNEIVPDDIADAWYTVTSEIAQLNALAAAAYDLEAIPQDQLEILVSSIDTPPAYDEEQQAAVDALAAWFTTNCAGAVTAEPTFTG